jgi:DNA-binding MltR family transcriptional regulator
LWARRGSTTERNELFYSPTAILANFSARILLCYALGIIDKRQRQDLDAIRNIRNVFAHRVKNLSFDHTLIAKECRTLKSAETAGFPPRETYITNCLALYTEIIVAFTALLEKETS